MSPSLILPNIMVPDKVSSLLHSSLLCYSWIRATLVKHYRKNPWLSFNFTLIYFVALLYLSHILLSSPIFLVACVLMVTVLPFFSIKILLSFSPSSSRSTTAAAQGEASTLCLRPHRSDWMIAQLVSPTPTFKKCLPLTLVEPPKKAWLQTLEKLHLRGRLRRTVVQAMWWDKGVAANLSPPQGNLSPPQWSPWQPPPHLPRFPLDLFIKVNWWPQISLGVNLRELGIKFQLEKWKCNNKSFGVTVHPLKYLRVQHDSKQQCHYTSSKDVSHVLLQCACAVSVSWLSG